MCEGCSKYEAALKGDAGTEQEKSAGSSGLTEDMRTTRTDVTEMDLRRCNGCAEPFVTRRARRQDHGKNCSGRECDLAFVSTQTNRSRIYTCETCQRHLCTDCHDKEIGKAPVTRATGPTVTSSVVASRPRARATSICCIFSPRLTRLLDFKQSYGFQGNLTAGMRRFDCKPLAARCKRQKLTQRHQTENYGAKWPLSALF